MNYCSLIICYFLRYFTRLVILCIKLNKIFKIFLRHIFVIVQSIPSLMSRNASIKLDYVIERFCFHNFYCFMKILNFLTLMTRSYQSVNTIIYVTYVFYSVSQYLKKFLLLINIFFLVNY